MARSGILYGESGSRKSTGGKHFSHYILNKTGKKTLLLSSDGGGWGPMQPEITAGLINAYRVNAQFPLPVLRYISKGFWPQNPNESRISHTNLVPIDFNEYGGLIVEGVTSISMGIMRHLADGGIKTGEDATNPFIQKVFVNGQLMDETFAGNSRGHYGFVLNNLNSLMSNFNAMPFEYVLYTGLESRTEDDDRTTIYGPQVAGKKGTSQIPSWVGDCIHAQTYQVPRDIQVPDPNNPGKLMSSTVVETSSRFYFIKHPDPATGIMFPAKTRVTPEQLPNLMKRYPGGYFEPGLNSGLNEYLDLCDRLSDQSADYLKKMMQAAAEKRAAEAAQAPAQPATSVQPTAQTAQTAQAPASEATLPSVAVMATAGAA
jgi:hypothetical protein